jgi:predicted RNase H-like HicB family nuclease
MKTELAYTYWQDGGYFIGFLDDFPNDSTQGTSLGELEEALKEVYEIRQEEKLRLSKIRVTVRLLSPFNAFT